LASLFIAMHFDAIRMPKDCFRATMSMILVMIGLIRGLGYFAIGEFRRDVLLVLLFIEISCGKTVGLLVAPISLLQSTQGKGIRVASSTAASQLVGLI
jgi:hypothetical protein